MPQLRRAAGPSLALLAALLALPALPLPAAVVSDDPVSAGLADFLAWLHPATDRCGTAEKIDLLARWPDGLRVRFEVACGAERRRYEALLRTRSGEGVWQVAEGFEAPSEEIQAAIKSRILRIPRAAAAHPGEVAPPPDNGAPGEESPLDSILPPAPRRQVHPIFPEEAGRARLIGEASLEILVDIAPSGAPQRARPLRGPDPDLGMREAAMQAVLQWSFEPALLRERPVRYFAPVVIAFDGLPPESRAWSHRALFSLEALVFDDLPSAQTAADRLRAGEPLAEVAPDSVLDSDWGLVSASDLPAPLRKALHEAPIGAWVGPVAGDGKQHVARKGGEVYFGILPPSGPGLSYQVVHQKGIASGDALRQAIDGDILDFMAERQRRDYMNAAARLMGIRQTRTRLGQLVIQTDVLDDAEVNLVGSVVGATFRAHQDFWAGLTTLRLFRQQVMVYAFARKADHLSAQQFWSGAWASNPPAGAGEYIPESRILAFPCESTNGHLPIPVAIHESIHMLDYERVYDPQARPSKWFEEGLADYFGYSQIDSQLRIQPGVIRRSGTILVGKVRVQFDPRSELREYLRLASVDGPVPLRRLIAAAPDDPLWSVGHSARAYGASWTLVHFLLHGERGRRAPAFREYAAREAAGAGGLEAFTLILGPDLDALEKAWHAYEETL